MLRIAVISGALIGTSAITGLALSAAHDASYGVDPSRSASLHALPVTQAAEVSKTTTHISSVDGPADMAATPEAATQGTLIRPKARSTANQAILQVADEPIAAAEPAPNKVAKRSTPAKAPQVTISTRNIEVYSLSEVKEYNESFSRSDPITSTRRISPEPTYLIGVFR